MILILSNVLTLEKIEQVKDLLTQGSFYQGQETAGWHAKAVKTNQQWQSEPELAQELHYLIAQALMTHESFSPATYAKKVMPFTVSKNCGSGGYGDHIDDALMSDDKIVRTDISCTVFLSEPNSYQGGELVMNLGGVEMAYKLEAGDAILYPSTTLHRVNPVPQGERLAALTWIESHVAQQERREILYDLDLARKDIIATQGKTKAFDLITKTHANLLRRWAIT